MSFSKLKYKKEVTTETNTASNWGKFNKPVDIGKAETCLYVVPNVNQRSGVKCDCFTQRLEWRLRPIDNGVGSKTPFVTVLNGNFHFNGQKNNDKDLISALRFYLRSYYFNTRFGQRPFGNKDVSQEERELLNLMPPFSKRYVFYAIEMDLDGNPIDGQIKYWSVSENTWNKMVDIYTDIIEPMDSKSIIEDCRKQTWPIFRIVIDRHGKKPIDVRWDVFSLTKTELVDKKRIKTDTLFSMNDEIYSRLEELDPIDKSFSTSYNKWYFDKELEYIKLWDEAIYKRHFLEHVDRSQYPKSVLDINEFNNFIKRLDKEVQAREEVVAANDEGASSEVIENREPKEDLPF